MQLSKWTTIRLNEAFRRSSNLYHWKKRGGEDQTRMEERPWEDTGRRWPSTRQGDRPQKEKPTWRAPWSPNYDEVNFYCLSWPVSGSLSRQLNQTDVLTNFSVTLGDSFSIFEAQRSSVVKEEFIFLWLPLLTLLRVYSVEPVANFVTGIPGNELVLSLEERDQEIIVSKFKCAVTPWSSGRS